MTVNRAQETLAQENDGQTGGSGSAAGTVKTGDSANIMLWVLLLGASVLGCFTVLRRQRRQK